MRLWRSAYRHCTHSHSMAPLHRPTADLVVGCGPFHALSVLSTVDKRAPTLLPLLLVRVSARFASPSLSPIIPLCQNLPVLHPHLYAMLLLTLWSFGSLPLFTLANPTLERPALLQPRSKGNTVSLQVLQSEQPTNGLPSNSNVTLQFVGLGVGVQNYSCASATSEPVSVGAVATLFDVTSQLKKRNDSSADLSNQYLRHYKTKACTPNTADLSDDSCQESINTLRLPLLGVHYFENIDEVIVPSFNLPKDDDFLSAQKVGDVLPSA